MPGNASVIPYAHPYGLCHLCNLMSSHLPLQTIPRSSLCQQDTCTEAEVRQQCRGMEKTCQKAPVCLFLSQCIKEELGNAFSLKTFLASYTVD